MGLCRTISVVLAAAVSALALPSIPASAAWPTEPTQPLPVATIGPLDFGNAAVSDGSGGAYVVWAHSGGGDYDLFAQHFLADGTRDPVWPASGLVLCAEPGDQGRPVATSDGAGGFVAAWEDFRTPAEGSNVFAQRIAPTGASYPGWPAGGRQLSARVQDERDLAIVPDGTGGAIVAWELVFTPGTDHDIVAARVNAIGNVIFSNVVDGPGGLQLDVVATSDGEGGAFLLWRDEVATRIVAQRLAPNGGLVWGGHATVHTLSSQGSAPRIAPDGAGGVYVAWCELLAPNASAQFIHRLTSAGTPAWAGPVTPNQVLTAGVSVTEIVSPHELAPDGVGGLFTAFHHASGSSFPFPVRVSRILPSGAVAPGWPAAGRELFSSVVVSLPFAPGVHFSGIQPDGSGGLFVAAMLLNASVTAADVRVGRLAADGSYPAGWGYDGVILANNSMVPGEPSLVALPGGHAFVAWESEYGESISRVYANRMDHFGYIGDPSPAIAAVQDVANDQGGRIRLSWTRSYLDADPGYRVGSYRVWRQVPGALARMRTARGARLAASFAETGLRHGAIVAMPAAAATYYWELAGTQVAQALPGYSMTLDAAGDSTASGNPHTSFMVTALHAYQPQYWNSAPDSGYSVDNLAPPTPAPFTGTYGTGSTALHWTHNPAPDFAAFRLYRGASAEFEPSAGTFVVETTDTGYVDVTALPRYYKLVAVDLHGNVSGAALVSPEALVGVGDPINAPVTLAFAPPAPNPARGACELAFTLPEASPVRLTVHDAQGRLVRVLVQDEREAGTHRVTWNGDDAGGRDAGSGLFFARFEAQGRTFTRKLVRSR